MVTHLFSGISQPMQYLKDGVLAFRGSSMSTGAGLISLLQSMACVGVLVAYDYLDIKRSVWKRLGRLTKPVRYFLYFLLLFIVLCSRQLGEYEFVYFQF